MVEPSARSKFYFYNTMVCLLKTLEGKRITVEIRNDVLIRGRLEIVESTMNLNMSEVTLTNVQGKATRLSKFYVKGRQIRFVQIPDEVDIVKAMKWQLNKTEYYKEKERKNRQKIFQNRQDARVKKAVKAAKQGKN